MMVEEQWLPRIDAQACTGCADCVAVCPTDALAMVGEVAVVVRPGACNYCALCESICPAEAIALPYEVVFAPAVSPN